MLFSLFVILFSFVFIATFNESIKKVSEHSLSVLSKKKVHIEEKLAVYQDIEQKEDEVERCLREDDTASCLREIEKEMERDVSETHTSHITWLVR